MTVGNVIDAVRYSIDEAKGYGGSDFDGDFEDESMDGIIKAKITDALRWCMLYAEGSLLGSNTGGGGANDGFIKQVKITCGATPSYQPNTADLTYADGVITLPTDVLKVVRVKNYGGADGAGKWHKSVMKTVDEDSEPYLMLSDDTSKATIERPVVALIESFPQRLELYPKPANGDTVEMTYVIEPAEPTTVTDTSPVAVPMKVKNAFVYYLAFLVLSAYGDSRAQTMLGIAKMELGMEGMQNT